MYVILETMIPHISQKYVINIFSAARILQLIFLFINLQLNK